MAWLRKAVYSSRSDDERIANKYLAPELHAAKGYPGNVVPELAERLGAGLIIMGTAARAGLRGMLVGNTSEAVVSRTDSSLLIVKEPSSFSFLATTGETASKSEHSRPDPAEPKFTRMSQPPRETGTLRVRNN